MSFVRPSKLIFFIYFVYINNFSLIFSFNNNTEKESKVSGGYREAEWYKYVASIRLWRKDILRYGTGHICGGTIITVYTILSAAHCFYYFPRERIRVVVGTRYRLQFTGTEQILNVRSIIIHCQFEPAYFSNDIALVQLTRPIENNGITTAIMPLPSAPPHMGMECTVVGWGQIYHEGPAPDKIVYANLTIITDICKWSDISKIKQICAHSLMDIQRDTCAGDSGGPLICSNTVYGITSYGLECGMYNYSGVYTSVHAYLEWIEFNKINGGNMIWRSLLCMYIPICNLLQYDMLKGGLLFYRREFLVFFDN